MPSGLKQPKVETHFLPTRNSSVTLKSLVTIPEGNRSGGATKQKNSSNNPMVSKMTPKIESKMTSKMAFEKLLRFLAHLAPGTTCSGPQIANHPPTLVSKRQLEVYIDILIYRCADRLVLISWLHPPLSSIPRETT